MSQTQEQYTRPTGETYQGQRPQTRARDFPSQRQTYHQVSLFKLI